MKIRDGFDPETCEKLHIVDTELPTIPEQAAGNWFGWGKAVPKYRFVFRLLLGAIVTLLLAYAALSLMLIFK